jgi:phosphoribosylglycinamide formyltransferase 1
MAGQRSSLYIDFSADWLVPDFGEKRHLPLIYADNTDQNKSFADIATEKLAFSYQCYQLFISGEICFLGKASEKVIEINVPSLKKLGILLSGRGSNFEAIADSIAAGRLQAEIAIVISNRADAPGLESARRRGLPAVLIPSKGRVREEHDVEVIAALQQAQVDLVCLAGYMRLLSAGFIRAFPHRIVNIHPSLLPAFPGLEAQKQALDYGVKVSGCTVHFVDEHLDHGPIILQKTVPVLDGDDVHTLSARILEQEHKAYSEAIALALSGEIEVRERRVVRREDAAGAKDSR